MNRSHPFFNGLRRSRDEREEGRNVRPRIEELETSVVGRNVQVPRVVIENFNVPRTRIPYATQATFAEYDEGVNRSAAIDLLSETLYQSVVQAIQRYDGPRRNNRNIDNVRGLLLLSNTGNNKQEGVHDATVADIRNQRTISEMIDTIIQSNDAWDPYDMKLEFFYNRNSLTGGAAPTGRCPKGILPKFWKTYNDRQGNPIACAAVSIAYYLCYYIHGEQPNSSKPKFTVKLLRTAKEIQTEMQWNTFVTVQEVLKFVEKYPQYRLTVFNGEVPTNNHATTTAEGADFDFENIHDTDDPCKNTIYIHLSGEANHYVPLLKPSRFIHNRKNEHWNFCQLCCHVYFDKSKHPCLDVEQKPKKCTYGCGMLHDSQAECFYTSCKDCRVIRKRTSNNWHHRCINCDVKKSKEFDLDDLRDGKNWGLYVWDIESQLDVETSKKSFKQFETEDGVFNGNSVTVHTVRRHTPILVCMQNVFTGEKETFYGQDCLKRFISIAISRNSGKNVFLAHNSSGYDSLLLAEEFYKRLSAEEMATINRGNKMMK